MRGALAASQGLNPGRRAGEVGGDVCGGGRGTQSTWVGDGGAGRDARLCIHKCSWTFGQRQMNRGPAQRPDIQPPILTPSQTPGRDCRERERAPHCRDRNPERKLGTAEVRGGRCCQTLHRDQGCGGSTPEGRMKKEPLPLVRGAGAVQGSREPRSSLKAHTAGVGGQAGGWGGEESVGGCWEPLLQSWLSAQPETL